MACWRRPATAHWLTGRITYEDASLSRHPTGVADPRSFMLVHSVKASGAERLNGTELWVVSVHSHIAITNPSNARLEKKVVHSSRTAANPYILVVHICSCSLAIGAFWIVEFQAIVLFLLCYRGGRQGSPHERSLAV